MRRIILLVATVILLVGCRSTAEVQEVDIRLLGAEVSAADLSGRDPSNVEGLPLGEVLIASDEIRGYDPDAHAFSITTGAWERVQALRVPTNGIPFAVCLDGEPLYAGCLWTAFSSLSYDGVVIQTLPLGREGELAVTLGYPGEGFFTWDDPRNDPRLVQALRRTN